MKRHERFPMFGKTEILTEEIYEQYLDGCSKAPMTHLPKYEGKTMIGCFEMGVKCSMDLVDRYENKEQDVNLYVCRRFL